MGGTMNRRGLNILLLALTLLSARGAWGQNRLNDVGSITQSSKEKLDQAKVTHLVRNIASQVGSTSSLVLFKNLVKCKNALSAFNLKYYRTKLFQHEVDVINLTHPNRAYNTLSYQNQIIVATWLSVIYPGHEAETPQRISSSALQTLHTFMNVYATIELQSGHGYDIYYQGDVFPDDGQSQSSKAVTKLVIGMDQLKDVKSDVEEYISDLLSKYDCN